MVRDVKRKEAADYLEKAEEFLETAKQCLDEDRFNAAGFTAVQAMINSNDALTIHFLEKRASKDHREALKLHGDIVKMLGDGSQKKKLKEAVEMRSDAGYTGEGLSKAKAEKLVRMSVQFLFWVKDKVGS